MGWGRKSEKETKFVVQDRDSLIGQKRKGKIYIYIYVWKKKKSTVQLLSHTSIPSHSLSMAVPHQPTLSSFIWVSCLGSVFSQLQSGLHEKVKNPWISVTTGQLKLKYWCVNNIVFSSKFNTWHNTSHYEENYLSPDQDTGISPVSWWTFESDLASTSISYFQNTRWIPTDPIDF